MIVKNAPIDFSFASIPQFQMVLPSTSLIAFGSILGTLTTLLATSNQYKDLMANPNPISVESPHVYDFIVVGSGSAGGIVANRLSENGHHKGNMRRVITKSVGLVLLLEAGGDPLPMNQIPFLYQANLHKPETDWGFKTVPQKYSARITITYPRGRSVGGSSNLNAMIYMRGCPKDFDNWASISGDSQWNYENVLPYFKKFERYDGIFKNDSIHHGQHGPIHITFPSHQKLLQEWLEAGQEMGFPLKDMNARQTSSFSPMEYTVGEGIRWETYEGYIKPALQRSNLKLIRYAHVVKINLNEGNEAVGVTYVRNGQTITVKASKEVILSAGAIGSPQLLLLSGIGPAQELISLGIKPVVNLPGVGKGLKDHPLTLVGPFLYNESVSFMAERDLTYSDALNYLINKQGPFATNPYAGIAAISTKGDPTWPDVTGFQVTAGIDAATIPGYQSLFGFKEGTMEKYLEGLGTQDASWVVISLGLPKSSGEVKLASSNPLDAPLIDPNYYSDPAGADVKAMVEAFKFFVYLYENTTAFRKYNTTFHKTPFPGCEQFIGDRDKDFECRIRQWTYTTFHPSSTCRMGKHDDPEAVVDSILRVRGVRKLRIADASVMPEITNANLNAPTMMIAEKAADLILHDWCTPPNPEDPDAQGPLYILDRLSPLRHLSDKIFNISTNRTPPVVIPCPIPPA